MKPSSEATFNQHYQGHLKHLKLKGLRPKTIDAYSRAIRRIGKHFDHQIDNLSEGQLTEYFTDLLASHSWSAVKLDLYGLKGQVPALSEHFFDIDVAMPQCMCVPPKNDGRRSFEREKTLGRGKHNASIFPGCSTNAETQVFD